LTPSCERIQQIYLATVEVANIPGYESEAVNLRRRRDKHVGWRPGDSFRTKLSPHCTGPPSD